MQRTATTRLAFAVVAIAFFVAPIAAGLVGVTAEEFENRRFADPPELSQGWSAFQQTSRFLTDRMPLRAQAVRANTRIWSDVFGTDPTYTGETGLADDQALPFAGDLERDSVVEGRAARDLGATSGRAGWLFLDEEFDIACDESVSDAEAVRRWGEVVRAIRAEGHRTEMFVVPSKAAVYPEYLPDERRSDPCARERKDRFWRVLDRLGPPLGIVGLRRELLRLKRYAGDGLFQRQDSHWTTLGALSLVRLTLDAIGGDVQLEASEIVDRGIVDYTGDLAIVGGQAKTDKRQEYGIVRSPEAERVPGRTLLVCDSFAYQWMRLFKPYFENVRYVSVRQPTERIVAAIRRSDTVVLAANELLVKAQAVRGERAPEIVAALAATGD